MYGSDTLYSQSMNGIRIVTDGLATLQNGVLTANNINTGVINANAIHTDLISQTEINTLEGIRTDVTIQQQFDSIATEIDANANANTSMQNEINAIDSRLHFTENELVVHDSQITAINNSLTSLDTRLDVDEITIATHTTQIATLQSELSAMDSRVDVVENDINALETTVATNQATSVANESRIDTLEFQMSAVLQNPADGVHDATLETLDIRTTALEAQTLSMNTRLITVENQMTSANITIASHTTQINSLNTKLNACEATIDVHTTQISALQADVSAIDGRLDTDENRINVNEARLDVTESQIVSLDVRMDALEADPTTGEHADKLTKITYRESDDTTIMQSNVLVEESHHVNVDITAGARVTTDDINTNTITTQFIKLRNNNLRPIVAFLYFNLQFSVPLFQSCPLSGFIPSGYTVTSAHILIVANFNVQFYDVNGNILQTVKANYNTMQTVYWNANMHNVKLLDKNFVELM